MRKPVDVCLLVVVVGILLMLPPLILIFNKPVVALGVPLPVLYVFGVWAWLVAAAVALRRLLPEDRN